jgi:hypothetical protein
MIVADFVGLTTNAPRRQSFHRVRKEELRMPDKTWLQPPSSAPLWEGNAAEDGGWSNFIRGS